MLAACRPDEVVRLSVDKTIGTVERVAPHPTSGEWVPIREGGDVSLQPDPRMLSGSELYEHYFGLDGVSPRAEGSKMRRYLLLANDPFRRDFEEDEVGRLRAELAASGFSPPEPVARDGGSGDQD